MKKNLNEEISRIKTLLNIKENNLILEANPILSIIRRLAPSIEGRFISGVETKLGKNIAAASEAEIKTAFKSAELAVLRKEIGDAIYVAEKSSIDAIFKKYNMSSASESARAYSELSALNQGEFASISKELGRSYRAAKGSTSTGGNNTLTQSRPAPIQGNSTTTSNTSNLGDEAEEMIRNTAKIDADALAYYATIEKMGFSEKVSSTMKLAYTKVGNKTPAQIFDEAQALSSRIDNKKLGWLLNIGKRVAKNPETTVKVLGKTVSWGVIYYVIIASLVALGGVVLFNVDRVSRFFGGNGGETNNTIPIKNNDVDWSKYKPQD